MRLLIVFVCYLLHAVFAAPQFVTFKDGKIGVNFGGYHADAGLGGLLTGNAAHGGLSASAGTPWGPQAAAGLGGRLDGRTSGVAYAGAQANPSVGASALLAGSAGEQGVAGSEAHAHGKVVSNTIARHHQQQQQREVISVTNAPPPTPNDNGIQRIKPPKKYSLIRNNQFHSHSNENRNSETTRNGDNISTVAFGEIQNENADDDTVAAASSAKTSSKTTTITTVVKQQPPPPPPLPVYNENYNRHYQHDFSDNDNDNVNDGRASIRITNYENSNDDAALPLVIVKHRHHLRHHERHQQRKLEREMLRQHTKPRIRERVKIVEKNIHFVPAVTLSHTGAIDISKESQQQQEQEQQQQQQQQQFIQHNDNADASVVHSKRIVKTFNQVSTLPLPPPPPPLFPLGGETESTVISKSGVVGDVLNIPIGILRSLQESLSGIGVEKTITYPRY